MRRSLLHRPYHFGMCMADGGGEAKAEMLGLRGDVGFGSRLERVVLISVGLGLAPWGLLQWPIYALAGIAWATVVQRILFVRRQLREIAEQA